MEVSYERRGEGAVQHDTIQYDTTDSVELVIKERHSKLTPYTLLHRQIHPRAKLRHRHARWALPHGGLDEEPAPRDGEVFLEQEGGEPEAVGGVGRSVVG